MNPPKGFTSRKTNKHRLISYRSKGMGCMVFFVGSACLALGLTFTGGIFFDFPKDFFDDPIQSENWFPYFFVFFYGALLIGLFNVVWKIFGITEYSLSPNKLTICRRLFFITREKNYIASDILRFEQIKDSGEEDSFPSWGLNAYTPKKIKVLSRETIEKSQWLGSELSGYYGLPFQSCPIE